MAAVDNEGIVAADERARLIPADAEDATPAPAVVAPVRRASRVRAGIRFNRKLSLFWLQNHCSFGTLIRNWTSIDLIKIRNPKNCY